MKELNENSNVVTAENNDITKELKGINENRKNDIKKLKDK